MIKKAALLLARAVFAAALVCTTFWVLYYGSRSYSDDSYWVKGDDHPVYGCEDALLAPSCTAQKVLVERILFLWLAPTVMALAAVAVLSLQPLVEKKHHDHGTVWHQRLLPPRAFWLYWCDGLTIQDLLIVIFWAATNAIWMSAIMIRANKNLGFTMQLFGYIQVTPLFTARVVARAFGSLLIPNLVMLFYPVSRGSVVLQALGISYPAAIRYHRWLGHAVLTFVLLHGGMYWSSFLYDGTWVLYALSQDDNINHLMGSIAFVFALCLWLSAIDVVRRRSYTVFKIMHHVGFWGFFVLGVCHYWGLIWSFLPGLMLYAVDGLYRLHSTVLSSTAAVGHSANGTKSSRKLSAAESSRTGDVASTGVQVLHADVSPDGGMCSLVLYCPQFAAAANGFVWLCISELSWFAHHPFTYVAVPWKLQQQQGQSASGNTAPAGEATATVMALLVHIKGYNRWTKRLVSLVAARGCDIRVKIQGPYAEHSGPVVTYKQQAASTMTAKRGGTGSGSKSPDGLVIVAGGNGITEAFSAFQEIWALQTNKSATSVEASSKHDLEDPADFKQQQFTDTNTTQQTGQLPVLLVWMCRRAEEFEFLGPKVVAMAAAAGVQLTLKLFYTGKSPVPQANPDKLPPIPEKKRASTAVAETKPAATAHSMHSVTTTLAGSESMMTTSNLCPVVALGSYWGSVSYKMMLHLVMFTGAFCAILTAKYITTMMPESPMPTDRMGAIYLALIISFMLVPGFIMLWIALLLNKMQLQQRQKTRADTHNSTSMDIEAAAPAAEAVITDDDQSASEVMIDPATAVAHTTAEGVAGKLLAATNSKDGASALQLVLPATAETDVGSLEKTDISMHLASSAEPITVDVATGRPNLMTIVSSWLESLQQQQSVTSAGLGSQAAAASREATNLTVYAMGPPVLVKSVKMMCDDVNFGAASRLDDRQASRLATTKSGQGAKLYFVRKTHEL